MYFVTHIWRYKGIIKWKFESKLNYRAIRRLILFYNIFYHWWVWYLSLKLFHAKSNDIVSNIFGHHLICFYALWCSPAWYKLSQFKRWCCNPHEKSRNDAVLPFIHVHHTTLLHRYWIGQNIFLRIKYKEISRIL